MASGKTLQSTIEISGVLSPSLQAAINSAVGRLSEMAEETLESADAATRLVAEMNAQEDVLKNLQKAYAGYVANGEEGSEQAQDLADRIRVVSGELEDNRTTLQAAEKAARSLTHSQEDAADAYTKLENKIKSQQDELTALRRQYSNVVLEQGESSDEARQLANRINDLSGELNQNKQQLREAERATDSFGDALEDSGEKAEDSSKGYTVLQNVIANLATETITQAIDSFKELALEGDTALGMLEARTDAGFTDNLENYKEVLYEVYNANYGESLGDVSETLSTVIQMTDDLDNASLAQITKNSIALSDVFGFDIMESLRAVNSLMDQFGISSDQAYNLIVQGAQSGLNQNDDLLDTINEYSVQFRNAGYTADDMFNMLVNGTKTGTWSVDKLGDAVKEFNIRMSDGTANDFLEELGVDVDSVMKQFNKGGPEAQKAIGTVIDAIMECDDATLQYQTGVGLFGTMWEDLGADTVKSLMSIEGSIDSESAAMERLDEAAYDTLEGSLSQLGRTIKAEVVQPIAEKLVPVIKNAVEYITTKVGPAVDWILEHLPEIGIVLSALGAVIAAMKWSSIVSKITQVIGAIKGVIAALGGIAAPVWAVIAVVAVLALAFTNLWKNNEQFREKMTAIWEGIKSKFEAFGQGITDRLNALGFDFENFGEVIKAIWDGFCNLLAPIFEGVFQQVSNILSGALDVLTGLFGIFAGIFTGDWDMAWQGVKEVFGGVWDFVVNTFTNWYNTFKGLADTVLGWFGTSWEEVWGKVKDFFVNIWNSIVSFFSGIWTAITSFVSNAWQTIKNVVQVGIMAIKNIISAAFQIITLPFRFIWENCKDTILKVWNTIKEKVSTALNAIKNVISNVWNAIKGFLEPIVSAIANFVTEKWENLKNNVSNVFNSIKSIATTVWNTIKTSISNVVNGIKNTVLSIFDSIKSKVSGVFNSIKSIASSVWNSIKNAISTPINAARDAVKAAIDKIKGFFNFSWSLPKLKLPHFNIVGEFSLNPPSVPKFSIDWYKDGGILTRPTIFGAAGGKFLAGGEAGAEAVLPLAVLWDKMESMLHNAFNGATFTNEISDEGLTSKAGELLTLDNFSLGSLADGTNIVYYYDFSNFTWSPHIQTGGNNEDSDDFMAQLKAHEAEFFDWLEEFIKMREVSQYA